MVLYCIVLCHIGKQSFFIDFKMTLACVCLFHLSSWWPINSWLLPCHRLSKLTAPEEHRKEGSRILFGPDFIVVFKKKKKRNIQRVGSDRCLSFFQKLLFFCLFTERSESVGAHFCQILAFCQMLCFKCRCLMSKSKLKMWTNWKTYDEMSFFYTWCFYWYKYHKCSNFVFYFCFSLSKRRHTPERTLFLFISFFFFFTKMFVHVFFFYYNFLSYHLHCA